MSNKVINTIIDTESFPVVNSINITDEQLKRDYFYHTAQKILKSMLEKNLVSADEFNKITMKNRKKFSPYLAEIMP